MAWYKNTLQIKRPQASSSSVTGQPNEDLVEVIAAYICNLQPTKSDISVVEAGLTVNLTRLIIGPIADIKAGDYAIDLDSGQKYRVLEANKFSLLPHMEIRVESGVI